MKKTANPKTTKWIYQFEEGSAALKHLLGGKGAGCAEMTNVGLPVPPGFTITTQACVHYFNSDKNLPEGLWKEVLKNILQLENKTGKKLGDTENPLLVSVRSGAAFSMPGMMDTVLNLGLNEITTNAIAQKTQNVRFALDTYRRFIQLYSSIVLGIEKDEFEKILEAEKKKNNISHDTQLTPKSLKTIIEHYKKVVLKKSGKKFPDDPYHQLKKAIIAVFNSWAGERAVVYRNTNNIPHDLGTAVNVQSMVFGNMGDTSGTGVAFTRDPSTGEKKVYGEFLTNAQGEDVVAGIRTPLPISSLSAKMPSVYKEFEALAKKLERHYRDVQDIEFTVENGKLYVLQTRNAQRTAAAAVKIIIDFVKDGVITKNEGLSRITSNQVEQLLFPRFDPASRSQAIKAGRLIATGISASPGAASGKVVFDSKKAEELGKNGEKIILVRHETSPADVAGIFMSQGILTSRGGKTSHAAVVARGRGIPAVVGIESITIDYKNNCFTTTHKKISEGDIISFDGGTGEIFEGVIDTIIPGIEDNKELFTILNWADEISKTHVWANADNPTDALRAKEFGAKGIGLCRTEHMFMEPERLPIVQHMIVSAPDALKYTQENTKKNPYYTQYKLYHTSLKKLQKFQRHDFYEIMKVMEGKPVVIRLLDPPLHEFLPNKEKLKDQIKQLKKTNKKEIDKVEILLQTVSALYEANPMLGNRGCRLGILFPEIYDMQVAAIIEAACDLKKEGIDARPEIMIPLIVHENELKSTKKRLDDTAKKVMREKKISVTYTFGTMVETPRAALIAGELAQEADFFSFGSNDLTQMTWAFSRDDVEGKVLVPYLQKEILSENPFEHVDESGVGELMKIAIQKGRAVKKNLKIGVCGEHGGDPQSILFFDKIGLDYVSASPFRVPVARLATAHAVIKLSDNTK